MDRIGKSQVITTNSIELKTIKDKCFAAFENEEGCSCLTGPYEACTAAGCPFYKPDGLRDWIRVEDKDGINLLPPEEYRQALGYELPEQEKI